MKTTLNGDTVIEKELKIENSDKDTICRCFRDGMESYMEKICKLTQQAIRNA
ncbi:MAG: hypothetical protein ACQ9ET_00685 [Nitrosomonadaceae bacterium]